MAVYTVQFTPSTVRVSCDFIKAPALTSGLLSQMSADPSDTTRIRPPQRPLSTAGKLLTNWDFTLPWPSNHTSKGSRSICPKTGHLRTSEDRSIVGDGDARLFGSAKQTSQAVRVDRGSVHLSGMSKHCASTTIPTWRFCTFRGSSRAVGRAARGRSRPR